MVRVSWKDWGEELKCDERKGIVVGWTTNRDGQTYAVVMTDGFFEDVQIGKLKFESWVD